MKLSRVAVLVVGLAGWPSLAATQPAQPVKPIDPHAGHAGHTAAPQPPPATPDALPPFIPPLTDADRRAAFPDDVHGHSVHDRAIHGFVLFDQLEWRSGDGPSEFAWDTNGWVGRDRDRVWFRSEGAAERGGIEAGEAHVLYGRQIARWWDVVGGVRQDVRPGPARTWAAIGIQGLAPYWFEVEATAYVGASGRTLFRLETEYELLLTNRLVLQPLLEVDVAGKSDPERGVGAGLSSTEVALRLRYEVRREFAPYVGVSWERTYFGTADFAREHGDGASGVSLVVGLRVWQ